MDSRLTALPSAGIQPARGNVTDHSIWTPERLHHPRQQSKSEVADLGADAGSTGGSLDALGNIAEMLRGGIDGPTT
ncbi:MAG TPA: hypothetical protein H9878_10825 [Candidatus Dietzia merdigallinarum]|nr:hypothetical protein [Candidatus Dietzia merdigallinarum]